MPDKPTYEELEQRIIQLENRNFELNNFLEAPPDPKNTLVDPFKAEEDLTILDLIGIDEIQRIQDEFATATGVASIIPYTDM